MVQNDVLDLARQSAASDLAFLLKAKEQAKARLRDDATQENIAAFRRAKGAVEEEIRRLQQGGGFVGIVIKTQKESVEFLTNAGFKVSTSQFNRDVLAGKVARTPDGYEEGALLAYAAAHLKPLARQEQRELTNVTVSRLSADAEMKKINAERSRLKLEKERGTLVPRNEVEEALAARALFFRNEIENFGLRKAGEIIDLVRGDPAMLEAFMDWWRDETADWMDAWSGEMSFGGSEDGDDLGPEDA